MHPPDWPDWHGKGSTWLFRLKIGRRLAIVPDAATAEPRPCHCALGIASSSSTADVDALVISLLLDVEARLRSMGSRIEGQRLCSVEHGVNKDLRTAVAILR